MLKKVEKEISSIYFQRRADAMERSHEQALYYQDKFSELREIEDEITRENVALALFALKDDPLVGHQSRLEDLNKSREAILDKHSIPWNYDQPTYQCSNCQDTGYDRQRSDNKCLCYHELLVPILREGSNFPGLDKYIFSNFNPGLFSDIKDQERYRSDRSPRAQMLAIKAEAEKFIRNFDLIEGNGLFFIGSPGTGKTFLAGCIANELLDQGKWLVYTTSPEMFGAINEYRIIINSFNPDKIRLEKASNFYDSLMSCDLLIIDDLGTEVHNPKSQPELLQLLNTRNARGLKSLITSNLDSMDLMNFYDERVISRIYGNFAVYSFFGDDLRLQKRG